MGRLSVYDCATLGYVEALELQRALQSARERELIGDTLLLLEHPPVVTMGKSAVREHVVATDEELRDAGATVEWIERGGETTYHGPGQLVGYAIFNLYDRHRSIKRFVRNMEQVFIDLLGREYGIEAGRDPEHPGVWVENEKITALGISIKNKVTMHGFAFNISPNLSHFDWIIPCGITDKGQTSLEELLRSATAAEAAAVGSTGAAGTAGAAEAPARAAETRASETGAPNPGASEAAGSGLAGNAADESAGGGPVPSMDTVKRQVAREFRRIYEFESEETILPGPPEVPKVEESAG